jgi:O-acetyl-ADP-ribose deacetylase (regulator of RNase III)
MPSIQYLTGDATRPLGQGRKIIAHVCNDQGRWGKGFVKAISARWPESEKVYRAWFDEKAGFELGAVQFIEVERETWVANMIGQHGMQDKDGVPPIRYAAVWSGLQKVAEKAKELNASVHMPRIGCGLAGGEWSKIEPIIIETLCKKDIDVTVYDFG